MNILIDWSEEYSVNIKEFDQQHKKLFDLINLLYDSIIRNEEDDILEQILSDLIDYTFVHFKDEEKYFTSPNLLSHINTQAHIAEHQFFLNKIENFQSKYRSYGSSLKQEVIVFLHEWITNHILRSDKKYMPSQK